jgi:hypothetical protein
VAGAWRWSDDRSLVFTPEKDWPIDAHYTLDLAKKTLLADGVLLNQYSSQFSTQPFRASLAQNELYQDPSNPTLKQLVATFRFSHPVDEESLRKRVSITSAKASPTATPSCPPPGHQLRRHPAQRLCPLRRPGHPLESTPVSAKLDEGIKARDGGNASNAPLVAEVTVPGATA